jgi:hypothetical protein
VHAVFFLVINLNQFLSQMKVKYISLAIVGLTCLIASCTKTQFSKDKAVSVQSELQDIKYQQEIDLELLKQKAATALQQLVNTQALNQIQVADSLQRASAVAAKRQDYSLTVIDVMTNAPVADADVTVVSEGKVIAGKTNAQGIAAFNSLILYPTSPFLISKSGYAVTQVLQQNLINLGVARMWNNTDFSNELSGTLYIETDLTNKTAEKVGANVLVTASADIPTTVGRYTVYFPAYTTAEGTYSLKLPAAPSGYNLKFDPVVADQKLYVNATEDDASSASFPNNFPRLTTIKTYYNVNSFTANVPNVYETYYFKVAPDKGGKTLYFTGYSNYDSWYNQLILSSLTNGKYQVERPSVNYSYNSVDLNAYTYEPNSQIDVEVVPIVSDLMETQPKLSALTNANGKITNTYSNIEGGVSYVHLKTDNTGAVVQNAKGVFNRAVSFSGAGNQQYSLNFTNNLNATTNPAVSPTSLIPNKGDKKVVNFYYGTGEGRAKRAY